MNSSWEEYNTTNQIVLKNTTIHMIVNIIVLFAVFFWPQLHSFAFTGHLVFMILNIVVTNTHYVSYRN